MKNTDYYERIARDLYNKAYSDGYGDGYDRAKEEYGQHQRGTACWRRATEDEIDRWGEELVAWCDCGKPIEGRWVGFANFCPWCGRVVTPESKKEINQ